MTNTELFSKYIQEISEKYSHEETSEMGYRTDFENLLKIIFEEINVKRIDHDAKAFNGNKPDYVVRKNDIPILYIEAKDIGVSLDKIETSEQMNRYYGYANLILTDYLEFRFYRNGIQYEEPIKIADYDRKTRSITPHPESFEHLEKSIIDFAQSHKEPIKSGLHLAKVMGGKAVRIRDNVKHFLTQEAGTNIELTRLKETIKSLLVSDLTDDTFADMYAQTLVYGLFIARYYDETPDNFSRQEARDLVPVSNPLLRHFFDHIVGPDFDKRLEYIVNELCEVFSHADINGLISSYFDKKNKSNDGFDPVIHFYEDFLKEYDPELRKKNGAFYTPLPVVQFIIKSVDYILEKDFGLAGGLSNTSKLPNGQHKVQILDPAVGTGTFLAEVINNIKNKQLKYEGRYGGQAGQWTSYVNDQLLPRLYRFEIMMTPYTIAHLKLSLTLAQTGFKYFNETREGKKRLQIYLTNSLESPNETTEIFSGLGFSQSISEESIEANKIKKDKPIMVVVGNPPYSVSSHNKGAEIINLIKDYKNDLNERNIQPLSDDYIKFIRFAESFVEKNKTGIVAMITNNSFIDGIIHRQMRKHLLETFDDIYIFDLHGNSKKKEKAPDGGKDENVFDIQQGVCISIFVRKNRNKVGLGRVFHHDLYGSRKKKFEELNISFNTLRINQICYSSPNYFFVENISLKSYQNYFGFATLFEFLSSGITTSNDKLVSDFNKLDLIYKLKFNQISEINDIEISPLLYRPFDTKFFFLNKKYSLRIRPSLLKNYKTKNLTFILRKSAQNSPKWQHIFISNIPCEGNCLSARTYSIPLYLYNPDGTKTPNLNPEIITKIETKIGKVTPEELFDYIYAVLHSPKYREKYKEFLKIDFPRVPYPEERKVFDKLVIIGREIREYHLLESTNINPFEISYPVEGNDVIEKVWFDLTPSPSPKERGSEIPGYVTANPTNYKNNKPVRDIMKNNPTKAEELLWTELRNRNLQYKFRRQHIIDNFYVDFVCLERKLVIEVDGEIHGNQKDYDKERTEVLNDSGFNVIRFRNQDIIEHIDKVLQSIIKSLNSPSLLKKRLVDKPVIITSSPLEKGSGDEVLGRVYINQTQYFGNVPEFVWNLYIGGYQPAQKWLKDRKGRVLTNDDIVHYQKVIIAMKETNRLMREVDKVGIDW